MGEARRRKYIAARDTVTGEAMQIRVTGDPAKIFDQYIAKQGQATDGDRTASIEVPCNGCRECCYHQGVDVYPHLEDPEHLAHLDTVRRDDGKLYLRKREDGACVHLGPKGCTVHEHRPQACRGYDCRFYSLFGILDRFEHDRSPPVWHFKPASLDSRVFEATCKMMGMIEYKKARDAGAPCGADDIVERILMQRENFTTLANGLAELAKASPERQKEMLGFDPRKITAEQLAAGAHSMFGDDYVFYVETKETKV